MREEEVFDGNGQKLAVGDNVRIYGYDEKVDNYDECHGVVTEISELDGDVNDEGRSIAIYPKVTVEFRDGVTDSFITDNIDSWYDMDEGGYMSFACGDVQKVSGE